MPKKYNNYNYDDSAEPYDQDAGRQRQTDNERRLRESHGDSRRRFLVGAAGVAAVLLFEESAFGIIRKAVGPLFGSEIKPTTAPELGPGYTVTQLGETYNVALGQELHGPTNPYYALVLGNQKDTTSDNDPAKKKDLFVSGDYGHTYHLAARDVNDAAFGPSINVNPHAVSPDETSPALLAVVSGAHAVGLDPAFQKYNNLAGPPLELYDSVVSVWRINLDGSFVQMPLTTQSQNTQQNTFLWNQPSFTSRIKGLTESTAQLSPLIQWGNEQDGQVSVSLYKDTQDGPNSTSSAAHDGNFTVLVK